MNKIALMISTLSIASVGLLLSDSALAASKLSAREIMTRNEDARKVMDFEGEAKLTTGNDADPAGKSKDFTISRKIQKDNIHNSTLTRFHNPAEVRDEGILIVENSTGKNDVLLYLPNFKKIRRVEGQQQSGSFMGSVFSYSDIASPHLEDFTYKKIKEEGCPTKEAKGIVCHVIECTPANDDVKERTGYSKSIVWVRDDNFISVWGEYYDLEGTKAKILEAAQIKMIDVKNKKWLAHSVRMNHLKNKEFTQLIFTNVQANKGISDSVFTQQNLQKVR